MGFESMVRTVRQVGVAGEEFETFVGLMIYHAEKRKLGSESNELELAYPARI